MFAYIKNNKIDFISPVELDENFLQNLENPEEYEVIEYSDEIKNPILQDWEIIEAPREETITEKRTRLFEKFITEKDVTNFDWEGYQLSENDYNQLIVLRNFNWDHGSQIATLTKMHFKHIGIYLQLGIPKEQIKQIFSEEIAMVKKISESRVALGLSPFDLSFLQ